MKKILLSLMTILALGITSNTKAQCTIQVSNLVITAGVPQQLQNPERCKYTLDATFDVKGNNGFKYLFFHTWFASSYPNPAIFNCSGSTNATDPGNVAQLGTTIYEANKSILDFGFIGLKDLLAPIAPGVKTDITANIAQAPNYPNNDNNAGQLVALNMAASAFVTKDVVDPTILHFEVNGLELEISGVCSGSLPAVVTDVWGSNSTGSQLGTSKSKLSAQCYICGEPQSFNDPSIALLKICATSPFRFDIGLQTESTTDIHVVYKIYATDPTVDGDPNEPGIQIVPNPATDPLLYTSGTITMNKNINGGAYTPDPAELPSPYCCFDPWAQWPIYAIVSGEEFTNKIASPLSDVGCATLPVTLKSFTAVRKNSDVVELKWETATEENSKGFEVQRKLSNGVWQSIIFVATKAINGNSNSPLKYDFTDLNNARGITQYRLKQVDIDGKQYYSQIRSVRGEGQKAKTIIYPNPSGDGKVTVVFEDANSPRDVSLLDVSGRTLKQWKGVTNNTIQVDNLNAGFYTVRIVNMETGEQVVEKFIVNKR